MFPHNFGEFAQVGTQVVGMSGGAYALLGMQLGDVLLNWERKSAPYRPSAAAQQPGHSVVVVVMVMIHDDS